MTTTDEQDGQHEELTVRMHRFMLEHDLKFLVQQISWNLNEGPEHRFDDPRGLPFPGSDGVFARPDSTYPFGGMCYIFRRECQPDEMVVLLKALENYPDLYARFLNIFKFLYSAELQAPPAESDLAVRPLLYFFALNGLFEPAPNPFSFLFDHLNKHGSDIGKQTLKELELRYNSQFSLSRQYQTLFDEQLTEEEQERLLQSLRIDERTEEQGNKRLELNIRELARERYTVFRNRGAHGQSLLPWTFDPRHSGSSGIVIPYEHRGKTRVL